jgi:hypothetical protein
VLTDRVEEELVGLGLNVPLAPLGSPDTLRLTEPVKPLRAVTVIV